MAYERGETDEFITPVLIGDEALIRPGDSVVGLNFRPDRMREITRALAAPGFFRNLPHDLQPLLESGILLCAFVAVILNAFFNGVGSAAAAEADAASAASSAQHV